MKLPDTEKSLWRESYIESLYPALAEDIVVDVAVIGAGITGLTTAYLFKKSGLTVAVIEKDTVGGGTTGRTTGKVSSQHEIAYTDLRSRLGNEVAQAYASANQTALGRIAQIIQTENISCEWHPEDNFVFTTMDTQIDQLKQEAQVAKELGLPASFETATPLPFAIKGALKFTDQAYMNAQKYVMGLAKNVQGKGSVVCERSKVIRIQDGEPGYVKTNRATVHAKHIVVATSVPTLPLLARSSYCAYEYPTESYIVAGPSEEKLSGMYISPDDDNYSILPVIQNGKQILLVGGKSHTAGLRGSKKARYKQLALYAQEKLGVTEITHHWSDRDYIAYDKLPLVGRLYKTSKNLYVASAFRKWGLTNGTAAAIIIHDLITGTPNEWAEAFNPHRSGIIRSIPHTIREHLPGL